MWPKHTTTVSRLTRLSQTPSVPPSWRWSARSDRQANRKNIDSANRRPREPQSVSPLKAVKRKPQPFSWLGFEARDQSFYSSNPCRGLALSSEQTAVRCSVSGALFRRQNYAPPFQTCAPDFSAGGTHRPNVLSIALST